VNIGEKIRRIRELSGISREDFSKRLGVSMHAIETLETSVANIGRQPLMRIAKALEISVEDIERFTEETDCLEGLISYRNRVIHDRTGKKYHSLTDRIIKKYDDLLEMEKATVVKLQGTITVLKEKIARLETRSDDPSN